MGRHYKHFLGKRVCPLVWDTAKCVPPKTCTLRFLLLHGCFKDIYWEGKTCTLGFLLLHRCFKIMPHKQKVALSDLHEAAMKQHEALHVQGEQKLQSRIISEAVVKQQFFSNAASSLLHANTRVQVFPLIVMALKQP